MNDTFNVTPFAQISESDLEYIAPTFTLSLSGNRNLSESFLYGNPEIFLFTEVNPKLAQMIRTHELKGFLSEKAAEHTRGLTRKRLTLDELFTYSKEPLKKSVLRMPKDNHELLKQEGAAMFLDLLGVTGDLVQKEPPKKCLELFLKKAMKYKELHDESIIQCLKQMEKNPNKSMVLLLWRILTILLDTISPSKDFEPFLINHIHTLLSNEQKHLSSGSSNIISNLSNSSTQVQLQQQQLAYSLTLPLGTAKHLPENMVLSLLLSLALNKIYYTLSLGGHVVPSLLFNVMEFPVRPQQNMSLLQPLKVFEVGIDDIIFSQCMFSDNYLNQMAVAQTSPLSLRLHIPNFCLIVPKIVPFLLLLLPRSICTGAQGSTTAATAAVTAAAVGTGGSTSTAAVIEIFRKVAPKESILTYKDMLDTGKWNDLASISESHIRYVGAVTSSASPSLSSSASSSPSPNPSSSPLPGRGFLPSQGKGGPSGGGSGSGGGKGGGAVGGGGGGQGGGSCGGEGGSGQVWMTRSDIQSVFITLDKVADAVSMHTVLDPAVFALLFKQLLKTFTEPVIPFVMFSTALDRASSSTNVVDLLDGELCNTHYYLFKYIVRWIRMVCMNPDEGLYKHNLEQLSHIIAPLLIQHEERDEKNIKIETDFLKNTRLFFLNALFYLGISRDEDERFAAVDASVCDEFKLAPPLG